MAYIENAVEWLKGQETMTLTVTEPSLIDTIMKLAEKDSNVKVIEKTRSYVLAHVPYSYLKIEAPKKTRKKNG